MKAFNCPNCQKEMYLFQINKRINKSKFDVWLCEDCVHIQVLDERFEDD